VTCFVIAVMLSTIEAKTGFVMARYLSVVWYRDIPRPLWYWYRNAGTHDTYRGIKDIAQHYHRRDTVRYMCQNVMSINAQL